jgi:hypothetical protein
MKYYAYKVDKDCNPIDNTERCLIGKTKRAVLKHLAHEEGVPAPLNPTVIRCKDKTIWCVTDSV